MFKWMKREPLLSREVYIKYGCVKMEHTYNLCPRCKERLNAGPNYSPSFCPECGQKLDFSKVEWKPDEELEYV